MAENENQLGEQEGQQNGAGSSGLSRLLSKDMLVPAAATAVTAAAAGLVATKGPGLKDKLMGNARESAQDLGREGAEGAKDAITDGGGPLGAIAGGASKLLGGGGGKKQKKTRRLPIQRWTDVAVPVERAYEQWTKFEEFPQFMHRVLSVNESEDGKLDWEEKIWFSKRQWQGEVTDRRENDRIAWKTVSGTSHSGVVSFHRLDDNLTRVLVTVDFQPTGMMEKMASGLRFAKRAVQADLARFKAYVEMSEAEGIEYESVPAGQQEGGDDGEDGGDEQGREEKQGREEPQGESSNGNGDGSGQSDEERDEERREREQRRQERREALTTS
jgi:uncharacterized membrane protein